MIRKRTAVIAMAAVLLLTGAKFRAVRSPSALSATRSFEITDQSIVGAFTLERVLAQLIARCGVPGITPQQMMRQLYDTQNPRPGLADPAGAHCDDTVVNGVAMFNGFPRRCPTPEGALAATPYLADEYFTLGIANRFDLAGGANCGQYRLIFARRSANPATERLHLIFEPVLPNPNPSLGVEGCRPVAQFWADLSTVDSMDERRARLEKFFFEGLDGFGPVLDPPNLRGAGGIRTLQQTLPKPQNRFYQFRLGTDMRFVPDVLENMAFGPLFDANGTDTEQGRAFRDAFITQVQALAENDVNTFHMTLPNAYLIVESNPLDSVLAFVYQTQFVHASSTPQGAAFRQRIQSELTHIGSSLTPEQIVFRAEFEGCVGCHGLGGTNLGGGIIPTPGFLDLPMISETILADGEAGPKTRYGVDPIIEQQFIPHRMQILQDFLRSGKEPGHSK